LVSLKPGVGNREGSKTIRAVWLGGSWRGGERGGAGGVRGDLDGGGWRGGVVLRDEREDLMDYTAEERERMRMNMLRTWRPPAQGRRRGWKPGALLLAAIVALGMLGACATTPTGYDRDTTPEHNGEEWIGGAR
jgi:hypothetical protein